MNKLEDFRKKHSYTARIKREADEYKKKKEKYLAMSDEEFFVRYCKIKSRYSENNITFNIAFISAFAAVIVCMFKFVTTLQYKLDVNNIDELQAEVIFNVSVMMALIIIIFVGLFFAMLLSKKRKAHQDVIFIEEVKAIRDKIKNG